MFKKKRWTAIVSFALAAVLTFGLVGCGGDSDDLGDTNNPSGSSRPNESTETFDIEKASATQITGGYEKGSSRATQTSEYLGTVDKVVKPVQGIKDEHETYGISNYPSWGHNLKSFTAAERDGIFKESKALAPYPTWKSANIYDAIDAEGYLLRNGQRVKYTAGEDDSGDTEEEEGGAISGGFEDEGGEEVEEGSAATGTQYKG
ncbi:MAG: hypothetical protein K2J30_04030, partial [Clostridia bacterium]|nr:hypothetical protein [Clostridia bacterium]